MLRMTQALRQSYGTVRFNFRYGLTQELEFLPHLKLQEISNIQLTEALQSFAPKHHPQAIL